MMNDFVEKLISQLKEEKEKIVIQGKRFGFRRITVGKIIGLDIVKRIIREAETENKLLKKDVNVESNWIPCEERYPDTEDYILLSFSNFSIPVIGRWEEDEEGGAFYIGDDESCVSQGMIVNAWQQLPKAYRPEEEHEKKVVRTRIEYISSMSVEEMADKIMENEELYVALKFCRNYAKCWEEVDEDECKKCLIKWLNSPVEQQKVIPTKHFEDRFNTVT